MSQAKQVEVNEFVRAYTETDDPPAIPGADIRKNERGYYIRLDLQGIGIEDATDLVSKAREQFSIEVVEQYHVDGEITKERRYVESVADVPPGRKPERGPKGGIYYETNPTQDPSERSTTGDVTTEVGYSDEPVLAIQFEDVDEGDRVAFEQDDGTRDMGEVTSIDEDEHLVTVESGDGETVVAAAPLDMDAEKADASLTSGTEGAHNAVYGGQKFPEQCAECGENDRQSGSFYCEECEDSVEKEKPESHQRGPYTNGVSLRLEEDEVYCPDGGEVFDAAAVDRGRCPHCGEAVSTAEVEKQEDGEDVWTYYYGPEGGEGWINMRTREIRYQKQRPGQAPEGGDGYDDWLSSGWTEPPDDPADLVEGQTIEVRDDEEYLEAEVGPVEEDENIAHIETEEGEGWMISDTTMDRVTAVEEDPEEGILDEIESDFESLEGGVEEEQDEQDEEPEETEAGGAEETQTEEPAEDAVAEEVSEGSDGWEQWTSEYDMDDYTPKDVTEWGDLSDFGFPSGVTAHNMEVGALPEWDGEDNRGLVFKTEYGPGGEKTGLGNRQMVTYTVGEALGGQMPQHVGHPEEDGAVVAEGVEGSDIGSAPDKYLDQVDPEEFYEQAAIQVICGNNDAHLQNVKVTPDGDLVFHDIDHSAGDITADFVGNKPYYDDAIDRVLGELYRSGKHVTDEDEGEFREKVMEHAEQKAKEVMGTGISPEPEVEQAINDAKDYDADMANNVLSNLIALRDGDVQWK